MFRASLDIPFHRMMNVEIIDAMFYCWVKLSVLCVQGLGLETILRTDKKSSFNPSVAHHCAPPPPIPLYFEAPSIDFLATTDMKIKTKLCLCFYFMCTVITRISMFSPLSRRPDKRQLNPSAQTVMAVMALESQLKQVASLRAEFINYQ